MSNTSTPAAAYAAAHPNHAQPARRASTQTSTPIYYTQQDLPAGYNLDRRPTLVDTTAFTLPEPPEPPAPPPSPTAPGRKEARRARSSPPDAHPPHRMPMRTRARTLTSEPTLTSPPHGLTHALGALTEVEDEDSDAESDTTITGTQGPTSTSHEGTLDHELAPTQEYIHPRDAFYGNAPPVVATSGRFFLNALGAGEGAGGRARSESFSSLFGDYTE